MLSWIHLHQTQTILLLSGRTWRGSLKQSSRNTNEPWPSLSQDNRPISTVVSVALGRTWWHPLSLFSCRHTSSMWPPLSLFPGFPKGNLVLKQCYPYGWTKSRTPLLRRFVSAQGLRMKRKAKDARWGELCYWGRRAQVSSANEEESAVPIIDQFCACKEQNGSAYSWMYACLSRCTERANIEQGIAA